MRGPREMARWVYSKKEATFKPGSEASPWPMSARTHASPGVRPHHGPYLPAPSEELMRVNGLQSREKSSSYCICSNSPKHYYSCYAIALEKWAAAPLDPLQKYQSKVPKLEHIPYRNFTNCLKTQHLSLHYNTVASRPSVCNHSSISVYMYLIYCI